MKRYFLLILFTLIALLPDTQAFAREIGAHPDRCKYVLTVTDGKKLNVRAKSSAKSAMIYQLRPGDQVFLEDTTVLNANGYDWIRITDKWGQGYERDGYVTNLHRFEASLNPNYVPMTEDQKKIEAAAMNWRNITKWILLVLAIGLSLFSAGVYLLGNDSTTELIIGKKENGMRRTFFFNVAPYRTVLVVTACIAASILASILIMLLVGGLGFCLLWLVKILCYVVLWVGIIGCIAGIIMCICGVWVGALLAIVGGIIWYFEDGITSFAEACSTTGLNFFHEFNMLEYSGELFMQYWKPALIIVCAPLALFLCLAAIWLLVAGILMLTEKIITSRYNIKHPCPHCQQPSEPARYLSKSESGYLEIPNGIQLRPGMYGLFHITHPITGEKMPTMILNGRDRLARCCANCGHRIQADEGTELHVTMVGTAQSGKSTLTYRMIAELFSRMGDDRVSFTDQRNSIKDRGMISKIMNIQREGRISDANLPAKTTLDDLASTQVLVQRNHSNIPYRLFINDVGGELFDPDNKSQSADKARFFSNVNTILMMIDPMTTDLSDEDTSDEFRTWLKKHEDELALKLRVKDLQDTIDNQIEIHGNKAENIHLNIVLPKIDLGYIPKEYDIKSPEQLTAFMNEELGLQSLLHWAKKFASCTVLAIGATGTAESSNIDGLIEHVFQEQLSMKV